MSKRFFGDIEPMRYEGPKSDNPFAFRHYDPTRVVMGKTMAEHLRPAVCYWHNFAWMGSDMFGVVDLRASVERRRHEGRAGSRPTSAFDMFSTLGFPFFTFHDKDVVPEGREPRRVRPQPRRDDRRLRREDAGDRRQAPVGHRQPLQPSALHGGRRDQSRPGRLRLRRGAGEERASTRPTSSAAPTTCCGAAAKATRRCSTPTCSASSSSSAASCRWSSTTSTRSASRACS